MDKMGNGETGAPAPRRAIDKWNQLPACAVTCTSVNSLRTGWIALYTRGVVCLLTAVFPLSIRVKS